MCPNNAAQCVKTTFLAFRSPRVCIQEYASVNVETRPCCPSPGLGNRVPRYQDKTWWWWKCCRRISKQKKNGFKDLPLYPSTSGSTSSSILHCWRCSQRAQCPLIWIPIHICMTLAVLPYSGAKKLCELWRRKNDRSPCQTQNSNLKKKDLAQRVSGSLFQIAPQSIAFLNSSANAIGGGTGRSQTYTHRNELH
jgi:hypothetical protein